MPNMEEKEYSYSLIDEKKYYTSTITSIPTNLTIMKKSDIPFTVNISPELFNEEDIPISDEEIIRCSSCKSYINPFIQILSPGFKWKCNICLSLNELTSPFFMTNRKMAYQNTDKFKLEENAITNYNSYDRVELRSTVYDTYAPDTYLVRSPSPLTFCFLIEITYESLKNEMYQVIINTILDSIDSSAFDPRSKMMFMFFNSEIHLLDKKMNLTVITDTSFVPYFIKDDYLFSLNEKIQFDNLTRHFLEMKSTKNNYGDCLKTAHSIVCKSGAMILSFLCTPPNFGPGAINPSKSLKTDNIFYKELSQLFSKHLISVTQFLFPKLNIDLPTLSVLSKSTGGMLYYYPNFDGSDLVFATKLNKDLVDYFDLRMSHDSVCRIKTSKDVFIKEYNGSLTQRTIDLLSFPGFLPPHTFNIDLEVVDNIKADGISVQVALMRTTKNGTRMIRVINFKIPVYDIPFYESIDSYAISRSLALKSFYHEIQKKESGSAYISASLISILRAYSKTTNSFNVNNLPDKLSHLPLLVLSLCKSIPLRPVSYTPLDFRSYYMYLLGNSYPNLIDTIIYPTLLPLHHEEISQQNLTLDCLETNGLYLLDTGVTIYFFIGKDCPQEISDLLFDPDQMTGRFIFDPPENDFSMRVIEIINDLKKDRFLNPFYVFIKDDGSANLQREIFFTHFYEDSLHGMPSYAKFVEMIKNSI
ncbi:protein transport protein SEC24 [Vairimorpha necatrix]|uniref:Protein transport protein SEC24 n=1 Tax=Vairimorpha necatrix TaxID=6039 RepID=A0AAX4JGM3_9MICR